MPSRVLHLQTPYIRLLETYPHIRLLTDIPIKILGCAAIVHIHHHLCSKLDPRTIKCIFLGYSSTQKGYKCYSPMPQKFYHSIYVTFFENQSYYPKLGIQGENPIPKEYILWDNTMSTSPISPNTLPLTAPVHALDFLTVPAPESSNNPNHGPEPTKQPTEKNVLVYSKKQRFQRG